MKSYISFFLFFAFLVVSAQKSLRVVSPYSLSNYDELIKKYENQTKKKSSEVVFIENTYYSVKKLDSLLLIKDKFKREQLIKNGAKTENDILPNLWRINDDIVLPYAIFTLKENDFYYYVIGKKVLLMDSKTFHIKIQPIDNFIQEFLIDDNRKIYTENVYVNNKIKYSDNFNSKYNYKMGNSLEYNENNEIIKSFDWDENVKYTIEEIEKKYMPVDKDNYTYFANRFDVNKVIYENKITWLVNSGNQEILINTENGNVISRKILTYKE